MRFWDSSGVVPLLVAEPASAAIEDVFMDDPVMLVWWATEVECASVLSRLERDKALSGRQTSAALDRLQELKQAWHEVQPVEIVRRTAQRLLRTHRLRASDSLQLAAAIVASEGDPASMEIVALDGRLWDTAQREGLVVVDTSGGRGA